MSSGPYGPILLICLDLSRNLFIIILFISLQKLRTYMEQVRGHALKDSGYKAAYDDYWELMHDIFRHK